jgi:peptidoglycan/xylan/chitin deacetylase (PgdA/CDA1 family)
VSLPRDVALRLLGANAFGSTLRGFGRGLVSIFTLHRFTDRELGVVDTDPAMLRDHLAYLRRHRYRLLSLTDILHLLDDGDARPQAPAVAYTVDDGYGDFARIAAPIFAEFDCPVTLFVTTGFLDGQIWLWWDRLTHLFNQTRRSALVLELGPTPRPYRWQTPDERARVEAEVRRHLEWVDASRREAAIANLAQQLEVDVPGSPPPAFAPISWEDVRRTARLGATFGPHTVTHQILSLASDETCDAEIRESCRRLQVETDAYVPVFCYPNGEGRAVGERGIEAVRRAGVQAALTTVPGYAVARRVRTPRTLDRFALPRFPYPEDRGHLVHVAAGLARLRGAGSRRGPRV